LVVIATMNLLLGHRSQVLAGAAWSYLTTDDAEIGVL
jgi:hypothetical protein